MRYIQNYKGYYIYENGKIWSISTCKFIQPLKCFKHCIKYRLFRSKEHRNIKQYDEIDINILLKQYYP